MWQGCVIQSARGMYLVGHGGGYGGRKCDGVTQVAENNHPSWWVGRSRCGTRHSQDVRESVVAETGEQVNKLQTELAEELYKILRDLKFWLIPFYW